MLAGERLYVKVCRIKLKTRIGSTAESPSKSLIRHAHLQRPFEPVTHGGEFEPDAASYLLFSASPHERGGENLPRACSQDSEAVGRSNRADRFRLIPPESRRLRTIPHQPLVSGRRFIQ